MGLTQPTAKQKWHHKNPERVAWMVMLASFLIFCAMAVAIPWSIYNYVYHSTVVEPPELRVIRGTVLVGPLGDKNPVGVTGVRPGVSEGSAIRTDEISEAVLVYPGGVHGEKKVTVLLYNNATLVVEKARKPRFGRSKDPDQFILRLVSGRMRTTVEHAPASRPVETVVYTPQGRAELDEGSYSISADGDGTTVLVRLGVARVFGKEKGVLAASNERVEISADGSGLSLKPAAENLIRNGDFSEPLPVGWQIKKVFPPKENPPDARIIAVGRRRALFFSRRGKDKQHTEISIIQSLNVDVQDYEEMRIRMDVMLKQQSLAGGGMLGSEYPVMIQINFSDVYGHDHSWYHGFYYRDPEDDWPTTNGEKILPFAWYPYESENLVKLLEKENIRPAHIQSIRIYASGWNYQSLVSEVELVVQ